MKVDVFMIIKKKLTLLGHTMHRTNNGLTKKGNGMAIKKSLESGLANKGEMKL